MTVIVGNSRRSTATKAGSRLSAMMRSGEQPARTSPCVRLPVPAPSSRTGPGRARSMQRATASARRAPLGLAAAIRSGFCSQRGKKTLASALTRSPLLFGSRRYSISGVLQFCVHQILQERSQNGHLNVILASRQARGAQHDGREIRLAADVANSLCSKARPPGRAAAFRPLTGNVADGSLC
jgi:hypothetical protein